MKYEIGNRIRKYREEKGINQKQLAELIRVSEGRVSNWEQGINRPNADIIAEICRVLDVSPSLLLGVTLSSDELSDDERTVIRAYRNKPDLQRPVKILLGIEKDW